ncbi:MAG: SDR family NAD(P)-dependent oxidoreductase, partial [Balneolaceae bacterium]
MKLKNKTALITGGSSGIGKASAILFASEGANVVIADIDESGGQQVLNEIESRGGKAAFITADVSKSEDCRKMVQHTESTYGRLDVLFNNAGIMHPDDGDSALTEEEIWDLTLNINAKGVFLGCKYGIPALRRAGGGSVINTASFVALMGAA